MVVMESPSCKKRCHLSNSDSDCIHTKQAWASAAETLAARALHVPACSTDQMHVGGGLQRREEEVLVVLGAGCNSFLLGC